MFEPTYHPSIHDQDTVCGNIYAVAGRAYFERLQAALGGQEIKSPTKKKWLTPEHPLVQAIGQDDAERLVDITRGEQFYVPFGMRQVGKTDEVARELQAGKSTQDIARRLGISTRHVRRLKQRISDLASLPCNGSHIQPISSAPSASF